MDEHGNVVARNGTFDWVDGSTGSVGEMLLQGDAMHSVPTELLELSEEIASMPELLGGGTLHDLRQAMARDESGKLKGLVESFAAAKDMESRRSILKELVFAWTGADSVDPGSRGGLVDARELAVLERYAGRDFVGSNGPNPHANAAPLLKQAYAGLMEHFYRNSYAGDYIEAVGEITKVGNTSRKMTFEARKVIVTRPDISPSAADFLEEPIVVARASGTCVTPKESKRK